MSPQSARALLLVAVLAAASPVATGAQGATATWETLMPLDGARAEVTAAVVGHEVYVIGGVFHDYLPVVSATQGRVDVYDTLGDSWRPGPPLPLALNHAAAVAVGERIYVIGGYVGSLLFEPVALTWVLDTSLPVEEQAWQAWVPLPAPRGGHAVATDGRTLWVFGGLGAPGPLSLGIPQLFHERTVLSIDLAEATPKWDLVGLFPDPRDHLVGAYVDGHVYAIAGRHLLLDMLVARVDALDVATGEWRRVADIPTARAGAGAAVVDSRIVVAGGESSQKVFDEAERYDPASDSWEALAPLPVGRHGVGVTVVGEAVYAQAGGPAPNYAFSTLNHRLRL